MKCQESFFQTQLQDPTSNIEKLTREKLTDEEFQNLYEALDFKWIPPDVCYSYNQVYIALVTVVIMILCLLKKKESAILFPYYWHLKLKDYLDKFCK